MQQEEEKKIPAAEAKGCGAGVHACGLRWRLAASFWFAPGVFKK
jgi:hypothetical protein